MARKCDRCDNVATNHSLEIEKGQKIVMHLCDACAAAQGLGVKKAGHSSINQLLTDFVKTHSTGGKKSVTHCPECQMTYADFQQKRLLGCGACYDAFEATLTPLLERAHEGGDHHVGKAPRRSGAVESRQKQLLSLRKRLDAAVQGEEYELAAQLRDEVRRLEEDPT